MSDSGVPSPPARAEHEAGRVAASNGSAVPQLRVRARMTWRDAPVVIDARAAVRREIGGVERVTLEMAARLPLLRPDRYSVMRPQQMFAHRAGHLWEQALLPAAARRARILYCPANLAPGASRRNVVVIHDLAPLRHPGWYSTTFTSYQRHLLPLLANRARRVITPSEFSRQELAEGLELDPERVSVVPNGVDERFSPDADPEPVRRALGLDEPYVLVVGTRIARKNFSALADARRRLRELGINLVAAGSGRAYMRPGEAPPMQGLGYVQERHLPGLYAGALALAMPSLYEGFGLPVLEAMASGVPVVAANRAALPETCGGAALLVDPEDGAGLAEALAIAATDEGLRERLIPAGLERASQFSWTRTAELTDAVIGEVLEADAYGMGPVPRRRTRARPRTPTDVAVSTIVVNHERRDLLKVVPALARGRDGAGGGEGRAAGGRQRLGRRLGGARARALPGRPAGGARAQRGLRRRAGQGDRGGARRVDRRVQQRHHGRARRAGRDARGRRVRPRRGLGGRADAIRRPPRRAQLGGVRARPAGHRGRPARRAARERPPGARALRGVRRHRRSGDLPLGDARPRSAASTRRSSPSSRTWTWPGAPGPTAGAPCTRPARWSTTTTRPPRATAPPPSSTWSGRNRVRALAKNATGGMLLRNAVGMVLYDAGHVAFSSISARTLAPLKGRLQGLREWGAYRRNGAPHRRPLELDHPLGFRRALRRHRAWHPEDRADGSP